jgi:hypothetical protein
MSPSTGTSSLALKLSGKLALALLSVGGYWLIVVLARHFDWSGAVFGFQWPFHLIGLVFGALVLAPYAARSTHRAARMLALSVASAVIYYLAARFIVDGPLGYSTTAPYVIAGASAAVLSGIAVIAFAPGRFHWRLVGLTLTAGALGGAAFEWQMPIDWAPNDLHAYLSWQILVCLALHYGLLPAVQRAE